jgi:isopentenyldiphosphate isomerase
MDDEYEILDLVDGNDNVIGTIERSDTGKLFNETGRYIRYAECFLQNSEGKLWIPRRPLHKRIAPGGLDFSASEHVQSGEDYLSAIVRGLDEELNLKVKPEDLRHIGKLKPTNDRPFFCDIYTLHQDNVPVYNTSDFTGYEWLTPDELISTLKDSEVINKMDLEDAAKLLTSK